MLWFLIDILVWKLSCPSEEYINGKEHLKVRNERRVTVYLSEEEYELLVERENESGKSR